MQHTKTAKPGRTIATARGTRVRVRWAVVEAGRLVASHRHDGAANSAYPAELQPRDRSRAASAGQVQAIMARLDPARLMDAPDPAHGAPVVGRDGVVESGNGRVLAIARAYREGAARAYRRMVEAGAARLGLDATRVHAMAAPVLVRVRVSALTDAQRAAFCREANESETMCLSPVEQAKADAEAMAGFLDLFCPAEDGRIDHAANREFITLFVSRVVGVADRASALDASGRVSQGGLARIRNAVFWAAYGSPDALARLAESTDNGVRNVTAGLLRAAPAMAKVRARAAAGRLHALDVSAEAAEAAEEYAALRARGERVADHAQQGDLLGGRYPPLTCELMQLFEDLRRSGRRIGSALVRYCELAEDAGSPLQASMLGERDVPEAGALLGAARAEQETTAA